MTSPHDHGHDYDEVYDLSKTRREFVLGGVAAGALLFAGRVPFGTDDAFAAGDPWTYTDDRNRKITRPSRPRRIVAFQDAAAALYSWGIVPVGVFGTAPRQDPALAKLPWKRITEVGTVYGELQLEKLVALKPDLIVSTWYPPPLDSVPFGFKDKSQLDTVDRIAPVLAVNAHVVATRGLTKFRRLSGALGANLRAPAIVAARERFERASAAVEAAADRKPGLRILAISVFGSNVYVARPRDHSDLAYFRSLGVNIVVPNTNLAYWEVVSHEQVDKYPADVIFYDGRPFATPREQLLKIPTIAALPAVKAGQLVKWGTAAPLDYATYAANLTALAGLVQKARQL